MRLTFDPSEKVYGYFWSLEDSQVAVGPEQSARVVIVGDGVKIWPAHPIVTVNVRGGGMSFLQIEASALAFGGRHCRLLILHPKVLEHFRNVSSELAAQSVDWDVIRLVVEDRILDGDVPKISEILSTVPDFDGDIDEQGNIKFPSYDVPETARDIHLQGCYLALMVDNRK